MNRYDYIKIISTKYWYSCTMCHKHTDVIYKSVIICEPRYTWVCPTCMLALTDKTNDGRLLNIKELDKLYLRKLCDSIGCIIVDEKVKGDMLDVEYINYKYKIRRRINEE